MKRDEKIKYFINRLVLLIFFKRAFNVQSVSSFHGLSFKTLNLIEHVLILVFDEELG